MARGRDQFADELRELGYKPELSDSIPNFLFFSYEISNGPRRGEKIEFGVQVPDNFPHEPPHGPCYRPTIMRDRGLQAVHPDNPAAGWDHWSRTHPTWPQTKQTVADYMRFIRNLNYELPGPPDA